ncbi:MAG: hypothetical protein H7Z75_21985, partial [Ferruginibacter sp.]|nr:hypothetical protein [Cytophagales bacterium]
MELSDLEKLWKENDQKLERSIKLNEKLLTKLNVDAAVGELNKSLTIFILGRNLAFIYFIISVVLSCTVITKPVYS